MLATRITIVSAVLLAISAFHTIVFQSSIASNKILSSLDEKHSLIHKNGQLTKRYTGTDRNQQCVLLMKKYSGEPFWEKIIAGRRRNDPNHFVEVFPHNLEDPTILMRNETHGNKTKFLTRFRHDVAFCTIAKNGCSRWRPLLRCVMGYEENYLTFYPHNYDNGLNYSLAFSTAIFHCTSFSSVEEALMNTTTSTRNEYDENSTSATNRILLRIALVRDPLARALSAWSEKVKANQILPDHCPKHLDIINKFEDYITCLYGHTKMVHTTSKKRRRRRSALSPCDWNNHFKPQSCHCHLSQMKYDMLLPVERIKEWFEPLVQCLGWEQYAFNYTVDKDGQPLSFLESETTTNPKGKQPHLSEATNSSKFSKLCSMYNQSIPSGDGSVATTVYDMAREIYKNDLYFSSWTIENCQDST